MKTLRSMLQDSELIVGLTTQHVTSHWLAKIWKYSKCDFVYIEYEHGFFNEAQLADFVLSCRAEGLPVVAKVPECSRTHVAKLLECGVTGIQLPWTETREQIDRLVSYVKFPPAGTRAAAPGYGNCDYDSSVDGARFIAEANHETVVLAHLETCRGVQNADSILSSPHVDIAFMGMYDLSVSCGQPGNFTSAEIVEAVNHVIETARRRGKVVGMYVPNAAAARAWSDKGVKLFETASEVDMITQNSQQLVREFRVLRAQAATSL